MKIEKPIEEADKTQVSEVIPIKTQKRIDSILPHKGHILFEINPVTGKCKLAEYESVDVQLNGKVHRKVMASQHCVYISALNKKNALIKFFKMVGRQIENMKK